MSSLGSLSGCMFRRARCGREEERGRVEDFIEGRTVPVDVFGSQVKVRATAPPKSEPLRINVDHRRDWVEVEW